jgi:hypothetical protein
MFRPQVGHYEDLGSTRDGLDSFDPRSLQINGIVEASGPSRSPGNLAAIAILQSAAASMVEGIFEVTVSTAEDHSPGVPSPTCVNRSMAF